MILYRIYYNINSLFLSILVGILLIIARLYFIENYKNISYTKVNDSYSMNTDNINTNIDKYILTNKHSIRLNNNILCSLKNNYDNYVKQKQFLNNQSKIINKFRNKLKLNDSQLHVFNPINNIKNTCNPPCHILDNKNKCENNDGKCVWNSNNKCIDI